MKVVKVALCIGCPYAERNGYKSTCTHSDGRPDEVEFGDIPDWCPLDDEVVEVENKLANHLRVHIEPLGIQDWCDDTGYTYRQVARASGVSRETIRLWIAGHNSGSLRKIMAASEFLLSKSRYYPVVTVKQRW